MVADDLDHVIGGYVRRDFPAVCLVLDHEDRVLEVNAFTQKLLGPEAVGTRFGDLLVTFERHLSPAALCADGPACRAVNFSGCTGLPTTCRCWFSRCGDRIVVVGGNDPREDETLRRDLLQLMQELTVRTRALQKANVALERLSALRNQFLGMATHDLRSPLLGLTLAGTALREELSGVMTSGQAALLGDLLNAADHMRRIVDSFLDIAQLESGSVAIAVAPASLSAVAEDAVRMVRRIHHGAAHIRVHCADGPVPCAIDVPKMTQVIVNLLNNAIQHSPAGAAISVHVQAEDGHVVLRVTDSGPGIPPDVKEHVFQPFLRAGADHDSPAMRRVGLGLTIARLIVEAHKGRISLDSAPSQGTTVTVRIPSGTAA